MEKKEEIFTEPREIITFLEKGRGENIIFLVNTHPWYSHLEIYRIVSQKSALSPGTEDDTIRPSNLETINVKPTVNADAVKKQCCSN